MRRPLPLWGPETSFETSPQGKKKESVKFAKHKPRTDRHGCLAFLLLLCLGPPRLPPLPPVMGSTGWLDGCMTGLKGGVGG